MSGLGKGGKGLGKGGAKRHRKVLRDNIQVIAICGGKNWSRDHIQTTPLFCKLLTFESSPAITVRLEYVIKVKWNWQSILKFSYLSGHYQARHPPTCSPWRCEAYFRLVLILNLMNVSWKNISNPLSLSFCLRSRFLFNLVIVFFPQVSFMKRLVEYWRCSLRTSSETQLHTLSTLDERLWPPWTWSMLWSDRDGRCTDSGVKSEDSQHGDHNWCFLTPPLIENYHQDLCCCCCS